jgi:hypothetical protein
MTETPQEAYDRGVDAGRIEARLDGFAEHFRVINGSVADTARELHSLGLQVQRLADQAIADAKTRVSTAEAVEKARQEAAGAIESERRARVDRSDTAWSPIQKIIAVVGGVATVIAMILSIKALSGK